MGRSLDEVALVQVVRTHAAAQQFVHERLVDGRVVVHAAEENALISQWNAVIGQSIEGVAHFGGEFPWMVHMDTHPERMVPRQHGTEFRRDPLRQENGNARTNPEEFNVRNTAQPLEHGLEPPIREQESIATRQQDVAYFRVFLEVAVGGLEFRVQFLFAGSADDTAARAVAAIGSAAVGHQKKHPVGIAVHESRHGHVRILTAGVEHFLGIIEGFLDPRNHLTPDRTIRVGGMHEIEEMRGDREGELVPGKEDAGAFFFAEHKVFLELRERSDPVAELPCPVVPVLRGNVPVRPVTWGSSSEFTVVRENREWGAHGGCV